MQTLVQKWRKLSPFYFGVTATAPFFVYISATAKGATFFLVRSSGVVALKVVQMPSTAVQYIMYNCIYSTEK